MNQNALIDALYTVINDNKDDLVDGMVHQGIQREIKEILKSKLTSSKQTYSISLEITNPRERFIQGANTMRGKSEVQYPVELHVIDFAIPQLTDSAQIPYETMHHDFRLLVDRLVKLFKDTYRAIPSTTSNPKFIVLEGSTINVANRSDWYDNGDEIYPAMYSVISFTMVDYCADSSLI